MAILNIRNFIKAGVFATGMSIGFMPNGVCPAAKDFASYATKHLYLPKDGTIVENACHKYAALPFKKSIPDSTYKYASCSYRNLTSLYMP